MKQLVLTGLATEQAFGQREAAFFLVFNNGEFRVPVSEQAAELVVAEIYKDAQVDPEMESSGEDEEMTETAEEEASTSYFITDDNIDQI